MMWGCFTMQGIGQACRIDGNLDAKLYRNILMEKLMGTLKQYGLRQNGIVFQHDNDPKHTARSTKQWLADNAFEVLDWPSQSPDLNPIEHLWRYLKQRLAEYNEPPRGVHELWERVQAVWNTIEPAFCVHLIESMPARISAVLAAKGGYSNW